MDFKIVLLIISTCSPLFAVFLGAKAKGHPMFYYVVAATITELISNILKFGYGQNIHWIANVFFPLELLLFSLFFKRVLSPRAWVFWVAVLALEIWFLAYTVESRFLVFNSFSTSILCIFYTVICLVCYTRLLKRQTHQFIERSSSFWILSGIFVYASTTSVVFALPHILESDREFTNLVWSYFYLLINLIRYVFIALGLKMYSKYGD